MYVCMYVVVVVIVIFVVVVVVVVIKTLNVSLFFKIGLKILGIFIGFRLK